MAESLINLDKLQTKDIPASGINNILLIKEYAKNDVNYKVPALSMEMIYTGVKIFDDLYNDVKSIKPSIERFTTKFMTKDDIENTYMTKTMADDYRNKKLTSEAFNNLIGEYLTQNQLDIDTEIVRADYLNQANTLENSLGSTAATIRFGRANQTTLIEDVADAINSIEMPESGGEE